MNHLWQGLLGLALLLPAVPWTATTATAQDDFGMFYELGAEKKLSRQWNASIEGGLRTRNNTRTLDRWSAGLSTDYRLLKTTLGRMPFRLKAAAGYTLLYDNRHEQLSLKKDGLTPNKWTPSYWAVRHRLNVQLSAALDISRLQLSLRERWQYTYRPEAKGKKYDIDNDEWDPVKGKGRNVLRSRLQASYDFAHWKLDPTFSAEMFTAKGGTQKMRYQLSTSYKLNKQHVLTLSYRYQDIFADDDDLDADSHLVGLSYKYKF